MNEKCKNALNINDFYDDSPKIFKSISMGKKRNLLKNLKNCYLTRPELNKISRLYIWYFFKNFIFYAVGK